MFKTGDVVIAKYSVVIFRDFDRYPNMADCEIIKSGSLFFVLKSEIRRLNAHDLQQFEVLTVITNGEKCYMRYNLNESRTFLEIVSSL